MTVCNTTDTSTKMGGGEREASASWIVTTQLPQWRLETWMVVTRFVEPMEEWNRYGGRGEDMAQYKERKSIRGRGYEYHTALAYFKVTGVSEAFVGG